VGLPALWEAGRTLMTGGLQYQDEPADPRKYLPPIPEIDTDSDRPTGAVWDTTQLQEDFEVIGFQAPFVVVKRRSDGQLGSLEFSHSPRRYWGFTPHCTNESA
jgi:hypothetical protein